MIGKKQLLFVSTSFYNDDGEAADLQWYSENEFLEKPLSPKTSSLKDGLFLGVSLEINFVRTVIFKKYENVFPFKGLLPDPRTTIPQDEMFSSKGIRSILVNWRTFFVKIMFYDLKTFVEILEIYVDLTLKLTICT